MVLLVLSLRHREKLHQQENYIGLVHRKCLRGLARRGAAFSRDDLAVRCPELLAWDEIYPFNPCETCSSILLVGWLQGL